MMGYQLPDDETLAKYMHFLCGVLITARARAWATDPQLADLLDVVHNLPC